MTKWRLSSEWAPNGADLTFKSGDRVQLPDGSFGTVMQNYEDEQNEDGTVTHWMQVKRDDGKMFQAPDSALKFVQGLDSTMMPDTLPWQDDEQDYYRNARTAAGGPMVPANYTSEDPLDLEGKQPLFDAMDTQWWTLPPEEGERAVVNAFRATMLSPRMNLKGNAVLYQSLMHIDPHESDPNVFEGIIRDLKSRWDAQGQTGIGQEPTDVMSVDEILPGKFQPGIWTNIRRIAALGPYADEIYKAAMTDMQQYGGSGQYFRNRILQLNIPGVKAKVASFAWLALAPNTSELGTIDVHMMRHLGEDADSPRNTTHYMQLEDQLRQERDDVYGAGTPLSKYQWGVWDKRRTPGFHQDHSPLRPVDPLPYTDVYWAPQPRPPRDQRLPEADPNQLQLAKVGWSFRRLGGYSIKGQVVGVGKGTAQGVAIRLDQQSPEEIKAMLDQLPTHADDYQKQRKQIPEWSLNRGGKVADMKMNPDGTGVTYAPGAIVVSEWVDVNDNWLLYHGNVVGIIAGKGGATSHGVVVARERNIPIIVNVAEWAEIRAGDTLQMDAATGIIHGNGGTAQVDESESQQAEEPVIAFVWSQGHGVYQPIPQGSGGAVALHREMVKEMRMNGTLNKQDYAIGVVYADSHIQQKGTPSDQEAMESWLNTIMPAKSIESEPALTV